MILAGLVVLAALAVAAYEFWRRRSPDDAGRPPDPGEAPPLIYSAESDDADGGADADGGDGGD